MKERKWSSTMDLNGKNASKRQQQLTKPEPEEILKEARTEARSQDLATLQETYERIVLVK